MRKKIQETQGHAKLKEALKEIGVTCGFRVDGEVTLNFSGAKDDGGRLQDEASFDVAFFGEEQRKKFLFIFQCKENDLARPNKEISFEQSVCEKIKANDPAIISSDARQIRNSDLRDLNEIRVCYVFGERLIRARYEELNKILSRRGILTWDSSALTYYKRMSTTVAKALKYQIFKELNVSFEVRGTIIEEAVLLKQNNHEMYFFGATPSDLLKICYVSRRASGKTSAYQRILNSDRIKRISEFVSSREALLPNAVIIAFDSDPAIQKKVEYDHERFTLTFPDSYCSAWIIDGQHRVYGFLDTKFEKNPDLQFRLPVVAFKRLDEVLQNRTFVDINYNQKKIDPTLLCVLATLVPDLKNELAWPSRLVVELNRMEPLLGRVRISELEGGKRKGKRIAIASFARYALLEGLLGYDRAKRTYNGPLYRYSPFNPKALVSSAKNKEASRKQTDLLRRYFDAVAQVTKKRDARRDPWSNTKKYALLKPTGINALLLVLSRILTMYPEANIDLPKYLKPLGTVNFTNDYVVRRGGGWKGFKNMANIIMKKLNKQHRDALRLFGKKEKS